MVFTLFIKGPRPVLFFSRSILPFPHLEFQHPRLRLGASDLQPCLDPTFKGRWMPSSVTEEDIKKLREARYLTAKISHRLPAPGQVIPTPEPNESVVFVSHFRRGLGFTLDPFVGGLMFYYGLDFHDLAPDSILHISSFIIVCEAFLRITPHSDLWLKTLNVKPRMIDG